MAEVATGVYAYQYRDKLNELVRINVKETVKTEYNISDPQRVVFDIFQSHVSPFRLKYSPWASFYTDTFTFFSCTAVELTHHLTGNQAHSTKIPNQSIWMCPNQRKHLKYQQHVAEAMQQKSFAPNSKLILVHQMSKKYLTRGLSTQMVVPINW